MKNTLRKLTSVAIAVIVICLASCGKVQPTEETWKNAMYTENTEIGEGKITVTVEVKAGDKSVEITVHTDKKILGDALIEHGLVAGESSQYGLYVKTVNGIFADYDKDGYYWGLYKDGAYAMTGIDGTEISDGEHYELVRTK